MINPLLKLCNTATGIGNKLLVFKCQHIQLVINRYVFKTLLQVKHPDICSRDDIGVCHN